MGRHAQPVDLLIANGNKHLTKAEIAERKESEIKLGIKPTKSLKAPDFIKEDKVALEHWKLLIKEYKSAAEQGFELLTSSDIDILAMYCKAYSRYQTTLKGDDYVAINKQMDQLLKMQDRLFLNPLAKVKNIPRPKKKDDRPASKFGKFGAGQSG